MTTLVDLFGQAVGVSNFSLGIALILVSPFVLGLFWQFVTFCFGIVGIMAGLHFMRDSGLIR